MLSSTVDLQGELSQALEEGRVDSPAPNRGVGKNGAARIEAYDSVESLRYSHRDEFSIV
jgi:hypothetical protein